MQSINDIYSALAQQMQAQMEDYLERLTKSQRRSPQRDARRRERDTIRRGGESGEYIPSGYREGRLNQYTPEQLELFKQQFSHVSPDSYLSRLASGDENLFNEMEAPAMRQFNALQGNLASKFSGMGIGARNSSGFINTANQAASDFSQDLASRRQELQRQAILDLQGLSRELLDQRPNEKFLIKKQYPQQQPDQSGDILGGVFSGLAGAGAGFATGGIPGAVAGGAGGFYKGYRGGY